MNRHVDEVLKSGYLTEEEKFAMDFELTLEANEEKMGEGAAMMLTCEQTGCDYEDHPYILMELPDGEWWKAENLPVRASA